MPTGPRQQQPLHQLRPTEFWQERVFRELKNRRISRNRPRHEWPKDLLMTAFDDLFGQTPHQLMTHELECASLSSSKWIHKSVAFSQSLALTSMVGYFLGVGDRHLDNILIDFDTGGTL
jgi:hypothetical protein